MQAANQLSSIAGLLACPWCSGALSVGSTDVTCQVCARVYPIQQGIALLARIGTPEAPQVQGPAPTSLSYQQQYQDVAEATKYNEGYKKLSKIINTTREHSVLNRLLKTQPRSATLLDLPAGGGRLSPALEQHTELLRVSKRFVIMTFFDHDSHKNRRRLSLGKPSKLTMTISQVAELANRGGADLVAYPALFPFVSGHRYAVMVKRKTG